VSHTKRVECATDRSLPPMFTKHATTVECQEMSLPIVFGGNLKYFCLYHHQLWPWMTLNHPRSSSQDIFIKYLKYGERYNLGHSGGKIGNHQWAFDWLYELW